MKILNHAVRLRGYKELSLSTVRIKNAPIPNQVAISLKQQESLPALAVVKEGDHVNVGEKIAVAQNDFSVSVHASISGTVCEVGREFIRIRSDKVDKWEPEIQEQTNWQQASGQEIVKAVREAGVVDLDTEAVPVHVKMNLSGTTPPDIIIINGCESEPFLTSDYALMLNRQVEILRGAEMLMKASGACHCLLAIEDNKLDAIEILWSKIRGLRLKNIEIKSLSVRYPQGDAFHLENILLGRRTARRLRAAVYNIATAYAVYEAVRYHKPLVERMVTVTGHCVVEPQNFLCRIGTSGIDLVIAAKGFLRSPDRIIYGGPMKGVSVTTLKTPVTKLVSGIVALAGEFIDDGTEQPCIRCGFCADVCPEQLMPALLIRAVRKKEETLIQELQLSACTECGNCTFICPSKIPMAGILSEGKQSLSFHAAIV